VSAVSNPFTLLGIGAVAFASTNIDSVIVLAAFFADPDFRSRDVVLGQGLGMGALVAAAALAGTVAFALPAGFAGLLGFAPLLLGIYRLWLLFQLEEPVPPYGGRSSVAEVAMVTIANGGDNLGVYVPLFAHDPSWIPAYVALFAVMTAIWCCVGYALVSHPLAAAHFRRYGRQILPFVLIALGLWILSRALVLFR
jgi:cadmium resistance protein CadD (predicted permease)